jgi:deoxyribonuclease IV
MTSIRFGLKVWSTNAALMPEAEKSIRKKEFSYVEITPIPGTDVDIFSPYKVPFVIHVTTERHSVNIADNNKRIYNLKIIKECIRWADELNAEYLILHPGYGRLENAKEFLKNINDPRFLIENMPMKGVSDEKMTGFTPEQIKDLTLDRFGFCLDFGHAIKASVSLNVDYKDFLKDFLTLKPEMFHISDGLLKEEKDEHMDIGAGEYDFDYLMDCVKKNERKQVTLETPKKNTESLDDDKENLDRLKGITGPDA